MVGGLRGPARFVVAVASGKGGAGKSTISLNLAPALVEAGDRVCLLDADFYGPDIPLMVNLRRTERWALGRPLLASLPLDPAVARSGDGARPIVVAEPDSPQAEAFRRLRNAVEAVVETT